MDFKSIEGGALRTPEAARGPAPQPAPPPPDRGSEPPGQQTAQGTAAERGVPRRLAVPQQLPPNTRFHVDEESNQVVVQILDENNEVIRQIPPEELLDLSTRITRLEGLLFNREF